MVVRAPTTLVFSHVRADLEREAREAAVNNTLLSKSEQAAMPADLLRSSAEAIRQKGGPGTRVRVEELAALALAQTELSFAEVNQKTGRGRATVSVAEVRALHQQNAELGSRVARAYESVTGRAIDLGGAKEVDASTPPGAPGIYNRIASAVAKAFGIETVVQSAEAAGTPRVEATGVQNGHQSADILVPDNSGKGGLARIVLGQVEDPPTIESLQWLRRPTGPDDGFDAVAISALEGRLTALGLVEPRVLGGGVTEGSSRTWRLAVETTGSNGQREFRHLQLRGSHLGTAALVTPTVLLRDLGAAAIGFARERSLVAAANIGPMGEAEVYFRRGVATRVVDANESPFGLDPAHEIQFEVRPMLGDMATFVTFDRQSLAVTRVEMT